MNHPKYISISGEGRTKLYLMNKRTETNFLREFPDFETLKATSSKRRLALKWIDDNARFIACIDSHSF